MRHTDPRLQVLFAAQILFLAGCGTSPSPSLTTVPLANTFAYTASAVDSSISGYSVNGSTGALTPLSGFPVKAAANLSLITTDPLGQFAVTNENPGIAAYNINKATGALTPIASLALTTATGIQSFAFNPSGTLLVASTLKAPYWDPPYQGATPPNPNPLYVFSLNRSTGTLTAVPGSPFGITSKGSNACCLAINAAGTSLYTVDGSLLDAYSINASTGALTLVNSVAGPASPYGLALDPSGAFVYMTDSNTTVIHSFTINASTGALSVGPVSTTADPFSFLITLNSSGTLAFTSESPALNPTVYDIKTYTVSNGKFTPTATLSSPMFVGGLQLGPSGSFLYAAEDNAYLGSVGSTSQVAIYSIGANGTLNSLSAVPTVQWPTAFSLTSNP